MKLKVSSWDCNKIEIFCKPSIPIQIGFLPTALPIGAGRAEGEKLDFSHPLFPLGQEEQREKIGFLPTALPIGAGRAEGENWIPPDRFSQPSIGKTEGEKFNYQYSR